MKTESIVAAALLALAPAAAAQQPTGRMGFVNTERIMSESPLAQRLQREIEAEFRSREQDITTRGERMKRMQEELERNGVTLSDAERQKRERELNEVERDVQRRQREFGEELQRRRSEASAQVVEKANGAIRRLADELKLDIIVQDAVFASPRIDITERLIKELAAEAK